MNNTKPFPKLLVILPLILSLVLALLYWQGLTFDPNQAPSRLMAKPLPLFQLPAVEDGDKLLSSKQVQGPALINVWATWCAACRNEHTQLLKISREAGVKVYGIDYQDDSEMAKQWLSSQGNPFKWVMRDTVAAMAGTLDIFSVPQTYLIDAEGVVRYRHVGEITEPVWRAMQIALFDKSISQ